MPRNTIKQPIQQEQQPIQTGISLQVALIGTIIATIFGFVSTWIALEMRISKTETVFQNTIKDANKDHEKFKDIISEVKSNHKIFIEKNDFQISTNKDDIAKLKINVKNLQDTVDELYNNNMKKSN